LLDPDYEFDARDVAADIGIVRGIEASGEALREYWETFEDFHVELKECSTPMPSMSLPPSRMAGG
jgi:hypothetical protein